jgi:hypothetical protein
MKLIHTQRIDSLEAMFRQVKDLELGLLLSGLTILVKDTATFLTAYGLDDEMAEGFRLAYLDMLSDNRYYWDKFGPELYLSLKDAGLPDGLASDAAKCKADLLPLTNGDLETEWLRAPGWHFFQIYSGQRRNDILRDTTLEELKEAFCEGNDPYGREQEDTCTDKTSDPYKPIEGLVKRLSGTDHESKKFWYPVMLYLALLLKKTNFTTLE